MLNILAITVLAINVYAFLLVFLRSWIYGTKVYRPMLFNIALSIAPILVLIGAFLCIIQGLSRSGNPVWWFIAGAACGLVWLLMLPNSSYLITELNFSHRKENDGVPLWFDIVSMLTLAMSGVLNMVLNISLLQMLATLLIYGDDDKALQRPGAWAISLGIILLVSFGMYLGRYLRFYSWDLRHPIKFGQRLISHFREEGAIRNAVLFCVLHSTFLLLIYLVFTLSTLSNFFFGR